MIRTGIERGPGAADLKFLQCLAQARLGTSNRKRHQAHSALCFRSSSQRVLQRTTSFGGGALANRLCTAQCPAAVENSATIPAGPARPDFGLFRRRFLYITRGARRGGCGAQSNDRRRLARMKRNGVGSNGSWSDDSVALSPAQVARRL